jgi:EAL domain-containing protein (putative c-di-GMP-specific phosphodiesterase class I)
MISGALSATGLQPSRLELEITESVLLQESEANLHTLRYISELGVKVALDDFGTGYSSLSYLQKFQFSKIKIDRGFVEGLPDSGESQAIVTAIVALGRALGMRITAEGVETQEQLQWLGGRCHEAQGYYLSRPVGEGEIPTVIERLNTEMN